MDQPQTPTPASDGRPKAWDWMFLLVLAVCLAGSAWAGMLALREGFKTEQTKRTGEAWSQWLAAQAPTRGHESYPHAACAAVPGATWAACRSWLLGPEGPMQSQQNAFTEQPIQALTQCGAPDRSGVGMVFLEKITPLPPGSAIPVAITPLADKDPIDQTISIRVSVCGKDTNPIRVSEIEF